MIDQDTQATQTEAISPSTPATDDQVLSVIPGGHNDVHPVSETPKTEAAIEDANNRISPEITSRSARVNAKVVNERSKPLEHPPGEAESVFFKGPGGWGLFHRDGDRWVLDPADYTSRLDESFDYNVGVPVVSSLD